MTHSLLRRIAAALALSALILGAAIRPALADRKDALKILGGLAALYVLNEAVERNRERRVEVPSSRGMPGAAQGAQGGLWVHSHGPEGEHAHMEGTDHDAAHGARSAAPARAPVVTASARPVMRPPASAGTGIRTARLPAPSGSDPLVDEVRRALERDAGAPATTIAAPAPLPPSPYGPRPVEDPSAGAVPIDIPSIDGRLLDEVRLLPETCATRVATRSGSVSGYDAACMQSAVARPGSLPPSCLARHDTVDGARALYTPSCLVAEGWSPRTAGR